MSRSVNMVLAGFGGQGVLFAGKLIAYAGLLEDREVSWLPSYGPEMRGGTANCSVCLSDDPHRQPARARPRRARCHEPAVPRQVRGKRGRRRHRGGRLHARPAHPRDRGRAHVRHPRDGHGRGGRLQEAGEHHPCRQAVRRDALLRGGDPLEGHREVRARLIENIEFNNGDDNVAIKCGRDNDGWKTSCPSENIIIRNCKFKGLHGVVLGSEMSSGIQHVFVENCTYGGYCKRGIFIKTNPDRGGFIRDIYVNNCEFGEVEDLFYVTSMYAGEGMDNHHFTEVHDIYVKDLKCKKVNVAALVLQGTEAKPIYNVTFDNVDVDKAGIGLSFSNTKTIGVSNCNLGGYVGVPSTASAKDGIFNK